MTPDDYLKTADVWTVLDLIVAEFTSDPTSVACFDRRLVARALELNREHQREERKRQLEAALEAPCPRRQGGATHDDPDNSGQCIYCATPLDIIEGLDY